MICNGKDCGTGTRVGPASYSYVCEHNNLELLYPDLINEWYIDNPPMNGFLPGSITKVQWICQKNPCGCHIWPASIFNRTRKKKTECPFCNNRKLCPHNNLLAIHPELAIEWHPDNKKMDTYSPNSGQKVKWVCQKNECGCHIWESTINHRTSKCKSGCPYCYNFKLCAHNNLLAIYPELEKEWHYDNKSMILYPPNSGEKVKWICLNAQHIWKAEIKSRTGKKSGCPICYLCPSCKLFGTHGKLCSYCRPQIDNKLYEKTKEMKVVKFLKEKLPDNEFIDNKSVSSGCTNGHLFPDVLFDCGFYYLIVEIDEFKHRASTYNCEQKRMYDIVAKLGLPSIFIRYNHDNKSDINVLLECVIKYLDLDIENKVWDDFGFKVEYLFY